LLQHLRRNVTNLSRKEFKGGSMIERYQHVVESRKKSRFEESFTMLTVSSGVRIVDGPLLPFIKAQMF